MYSIGLHCQQTVWRNTRFLQKGKWRAVELAFRCSIFAKMPTFSPKMSVANFTCLFGDKFVMLDLFDEVIYPAFSMPRKRVYGDATFSLLDTKLVKFADGELAFIGRLVKDTQIERDQIIVNGQLQKDYAVLPSAPTSFFVLLLSNHKLLYVPEFRGAPTISQFASTLGSFISNAYGEWTRRLYDQAHANGKKLTWKELREQCPPPVLEITQMATESSVSAFVSKFRAINSVEVRVLDTNHELDNSPIFGQMRGIKDKIHADQVVLRTQKSGDVGLDKGAVTALIAHQAEDGNAQITLKGKGVNGDKLLAKNDSFNATFEIQTLPTSVINAAVKVYDKLLNQIGLGTITLRKGDGAAMQKIKGIVERYWP